MLYKVLIKNFYSIKDEVTIKINNNITSIIGKNESGKSTILKAISKLNGNKIESVEKNVELKSEKSYIKGFFILDKSDIKKINEEYESEYDLGFYSLPEKYNKLYYSIEVNDQSSSRLFHLYYQNENKEYVPISSKFFLNRIIEELKRIEKNANLSKEQKDNISKLYLLSEKDIQSEIDNNLVNLDFDDTIKDLLRKVSSQICVNKWITLLPKYNFIFFSSFESILKDNVLFSELESNPQVNNLLKIAKVDIDELSIAYEEANEQVLEDLGAQFVDVVSKKFKEIFKQTDENFKIKIRFGSAKKDLSFYTQDKTSGTRTINIGNRSDGFKWYLSLYLTLYDYLDCSDDSTKYVLLLDEPNLYLHPGAQHNLLYNVLYNEFSDTQIIYTTHSPYMIDSDNSYTVRIVEKEEQTYIYNSSREYAELTNNIKDVDTMTPLLTALELNISNTLTIDSKDILIAVEGIQDVYIITSMIEILKMSSKFKNIKFIPCTSASKVPYLYCYLYGMGYNVYALFDNDKSGRDAIKEIIDGDLEDERVKRMFKYDLANPSSSNFLLEDLFSNDDRKQYLPSKSTLLYKTIFDERKKIKFDAITLKNFKDFLNKLLIELM